MSSGDHKENNRPEGHPFFGKPISRLQLTLAFFVAGLADVVLAPVQLTGPFSLGVDFATAILLFMILGLRMILLPALIAEAIPGVGIFPLWILVVGSIAVFGTIRKPGGKEAFPMRPELYTESDTPEDSEPERKIPPVFEERKRKASSASSEPIIDIPFEDIPPEKSEQ